VALGLPVWASAQSARAARSPASAIIAGADTIDMEWLQWTTGRYRVSPGDVLEFKFTFVPELNQTATVQPDGFISLEEVGDIKVHGRTLDQIKEDVTAAYAPVVREPLFTIALTQFQKPFFIASGQLEAPGRYELSGPTTLTHALALAGGTSVGADLSEILLVRRWGDLVDVKEIDVKRMLARRDLSEDPLLRPGDMIVVGKSAIGKLAPLLNMLRWRH
jgi:polysaccharide export outer membrane protein